jgi:hypothetical protein
MCSQQNGKYHSRILNKFLSLKTEAREEKQKYICSMNEHEAMPQLQVDGAHLQRKVPFNNCIALSQIFLITILLSNHLKAQWTSRSRITTTRLCTWI